MLIIGLLDVPPHPKASIFTQNLSLLAIHDMAAIPYINGLTRSDLPGDPEHLIILGT